MTDTDYDWRHGWVPLTMRAALQKAHGNREAAAELLGQARADRASRRREFVSPHPTHRAEHAEHKRWARYSDDDLSDELGAGHDEADVDRILDEQLRAGGYSGRTFRDRVKTAHTEHVREAYLAAEEACRGHMLSPEGKRAGVSAESLFSGPAATAKKYASEELREYFRRHGRMTLEDFTAGVLGGHAKFRTTGDDW